MLYKLQKVSSGNVTLEIKLRKLLNALYYEAYAIIVGNAFSFTTVYGLRFSFTS